MDENSGKLIDDDDTDGSCIGAAVTIAYRIAKAIGTIEASGRSVGDIALIIVDLSISSLCY